MSTLITCVHGVEKSNIISGASWYIIRTAQIMYNYDVPKDSETDSDDLNNF